MRSEYESKLDVRLDRFPFCLKMVSLKHVGVKNYARNTFTFSMIEQFKQMNRFKPVRFLNKLNCKQRRTSVLENSKSLTIDPGLYITENTTKPFEGRIFLTTKRVDE